MDAQESGEISPDFRILAVVPEFVEALMQKPAEKKITWTLVGGEPEAKWEGGEKSVHAQL